MITSLFCFVLLLRFGIFLTLSYVFRLICICLRGGSLNTFLLGRGWEKRYFYLLHSQSFVFSRTFCETVLLDSTLFVRTVCFVCVWYILVFFCVRHFVGNGGFFKLHMNKMNVLQTCAKTEMKQSIVHQNQKTENIGKT